MGCKVVGSSKTALVIGASRTQASMNHVYSAVSTSFAFPDRFVCD